MKEIRITAHQGVTYIEELPAGFNHIPALIKAYYEEKSEKVVKKAIKYADSYNAKLYNGLAVVRVLA